MVKRAFGKINEYVPRAAVVLYISALAAALVRLIAEFNTAFADFVNTYINSYVRAVLAGLTGWIPRSVAEILLLSSPLILGFLIYRCIKISGRGWRHVIRYITGILSVIAYVYAAFVFTYGLGYNTETLDVKLGLEKNEVSTEQLYNTALELTNGINAELDSVEFASDGSSEMDYGVRELSEKLVSAYDSFCAENRFIKNYTSYVKPVMLSEKLTYTHLSGIYSFMTGEANINVNYPDFIIPFTAAHEMAHQRGIAREDEANFVAFLVCLRSDDAYIRYSAYMELYSYVMNALYGASPELYAKAYSKLDTRARGEKKAYSEFFKKYSESTASKVSDTLNNAWLQSQGQTAGTKSYGLVVDLAVAYYERTF